MEKQIILVTEEPRGASQLVEIPVTANGLSSVPFPNVQQLQSDTEITVIIKGIRLITPEVLSRGITSQGANAAITELQKMAVQLYSEGWQKGFNIPVLTMNDVYVSATTPHVYSPFRLDDWKRVDWSKTNLVFANGTVSVGAPYVVLMDIQYVRLDKQGRVVTTAQ